jgi:glycosyltransferase involved in cell wall biosynthesis
MILLFGPFPPPLNGLSVVTQAVYDRLKSSGISLLRMNTSSPSNKSGLYRLARVPTFIHSWYKLIHFGRNRILYIPLSGGLGQLYDIATLFLARILGMRCILHHHSMAYLFSTNLITKILCMVAGKNATHIVLCAVMKNALIEKYSCQNIILLSNLAFFPKEPIHRVRKELKTIAFLSNLTTEKGGWEVIDLAREIKNRGIPLQIVIGGPCLERELSQALRQAENEGVLRWRGPVYGEEKKLFWDEVDLFVFPSKYRNEAEPLVVWEALAAGIPVIASDRGCVHCQVGEAGRIIPKGHDFISEALEVLEEWRCEPAKYKDVVIVAEDRYRFNRANAEIQWKIFSNLFQQRM